jgi:Flp pilus assembly pilin Flp
MQLLSPNKFFQFCSGVAILEYGLIAATILTVSITALSILGRNLDSSLNLFGNSLKQQQVVNLQVAQLTSAQTPSTTTPLLNPVMHSAGSTTMTLTLQNGTTINLPGYPEDLSKTILTVGANGTTEILLAQLNRLIQELVDKGEIYPEQASSLSVLANHGHEIAEREKFIENYLAQHKDASELPLVPVVYNGETYPDIRDLAASLDIMATGKQKGAQLALSKELDKAIASGALKDPAIKALVELLVGNISSIADTVSNATGSCADSRITPDEVIDYMASKQSHHNSTRICDTGNGQDNSVYCK